MRFTSPNSPWIRLYCFILLGTCNCGVHHNYCFVWCQRDYHIVLCTFRFLRFRLDNYIGNLELWCICCCCLFPPWSISCFVLIYSCPYSLLIIKRKTKFQSKDQWQLKKAYILTANWTFVFFGRSPKLTDMFELEDVILDSSMAATVFFWISITIFVFL